MHVDSGHLTTSQDAKAALAGVSYEATQMRVQALHSFAAQQTTDISFCAGCVPVCLFI